MVLELPKALVRRQPMLLAIQLSVVVVKGHQVDSQLESTGAQRALDRLEGRLHPSRLPPSDGGLAGTQPSGQFPLGQAGTSAPLPDDASTCHRRDDISSDIDRTKPAQLGVEPSADNQSGGTAAAASIRAMRAGPTRTGSTRNGANASSRSGDARNSSTSLPAAALW